MDELEFTGNVFRALGRMRAVSIVSDVCSCEMSVTSCEEMNGTKPEKMVCIVYISAGDRGVSR